MREPIKFLQNYCQELALSNFKVATEYNQDFLDFLVEKYTQNQIDPEDIYAFLDTSNGLDGSEGIIFSDHGMVISSEEGIQVVPYNEISSFSEEDNKIYAYLFADESEGEEADATFDGAPEEESVLVVSGDKLVSLDNFGWFLRTLRAKHILEEGANPPYLPPFEECFGVNESEVGVAPAGAVSLSALQETLDAFEALNEDDPDQQFEIDQNDILGVRTIRTNANGLQNALIFTSEGIYFIYGDDAGYILYSEINEIYIDEDVAANTESAYCEIHYEEDGQYLGDSIAIANFDNDQQLADNFESWLNDVVLAANCRK